MVLFVDMTLHVLGTGFGGGFGGYRASHYPIQSVLLSLSLRRKDQLLVHTDESGLVISVGSSVMTDSVPDCA